jgi:hypothetical protein
MMIELNLNAQPTNQPLHLAKWAQFLGAAFNQQHRDCYDSIFVEIESSLFIIHKQRLDVDAGAHEEHASHSVPLGR